MLKKKYNKSEYRFRNLFENSGIAIWEADLSEVKKSINQIKESGIRDFRLYFDQHMNEVIKCASMVKLLDANKEILNLVKAKSKKQVLNNLSDFFIEESFAAVKEVLIGLAEGNLRIDGEIPLKILTGEIRQVLFQLSIVPGEEDTWAQGLISFIDITEKKKTEQALRESEKHLQEILENVDAVFYMMSGKTGEIVYINSAYEKIWERPVAEIKKNPETWLDAVHPEDVNSAKKLFEKGSGELHYRILLPDGSIRWIWDRMFPILDEKGEIQYLCGMAADITERKLYEAEILRSERNYRNLFENAGIAIWEEDLSDVRIYIDKLKETGIDDFRLYFNKRIDEVIKCASLVKLLDVNNEVLNVVKAKNKEEVIRSLPAFFIEESMDAAKEEIIALAEGKRRIDGEMPIKIMNGEIKQVLFQLTIVPGYEDTWAKALFSFIDITERKRIEESLRLFRTLLDKSNDAIELFDTETGQIVDVNERACTDLGYSRSELLGMNVFDMDPNQNQHSFKEALMNFQPSNSTIIESSHRRKDGSVYPIEVNVTVVELEKIYTIAIVRDITERKLADKKLAASEERYKLLFESAAEGILVVDVETQELKLVNKAACQMFGYTEQEMTGLSISNLHPVEYLKDLISAIRISGSGQWPGIRRIAMQKKRRHIILCKRL